MLRVLNVSKEFSDIPGPRYISEGAFSGELFRETVLFPLVKECIDKGDELEINLDGTQGYGTSFLEEAFGGLVRENHLSLDAVTGCIHFITNEEPYLEDDIRQYFEDAANEANIK